MAAAWCWGDARGRASVGGGATASGLELGLERRDLVDEIDEDARADAVARPHSRGRVERAVPASSAIDR